VIKPDAWLSISDGVPHRRHAEKPLRRNVDDVDASVHRLEPSEIPVSDVSRDKLRVLRDVKSESWRHSDRAVSASNRLIAGPIGRMNDQQPTESRELVVHGTNHGSIQRCDPIRLIPTIGCDQHLTRGVCVANGWMPVHGFRVVHVTV
jgi:hypothetical protein